MKPILFNTETVKAILDGRKTVTRRVVKKDKADAVLSSRAEWKTRTYLTTDLSSAFAPHRAKSAMSCMYGRRGHTDMYTLLILSADATIVFLRN